MSNENSQNESPVLIAALELASRGFKILPACPVTGCKSATCKPGKHPLVGSWPTAASNDPEQIRKWFNKYPTAGVGILTGPRSGVFVIDIDGPEGRQSLYQFFEKRNWNPFTLTAITSRGMHYYFKYPSVRVGCSVGLLPGLDIRGEDGFIVAPPSLHASGTQYRWLSPNAPIEEAPDWLIQLVSQPKAPEAKQPASGISIVEDVVIEQGDRHKKLVSIAGSLRTNGQDESEILEHLRDVNKDACQPPLSDAEVAKIATSVAKYEAGSKRSSYETRRAARENPPMFWMPINVATWLSDREFRFMTPAERGMYMKLVFESWPSCGVLEDDDTLWQLAGAESKEAFEQATIVLGKFDACEDEQGNPILVSRIVRTLWREQEGKLKPKSKGGKASGEARRKKALEKKLKEEQLAKEKAA